MAEAVSRSDRRATRVGLALVVLLAVALVVVTRAYFDERDRSGLVMGDHERDEMVHACYGGGASATTCDDAVQQILNHRPEHRCDANRVELLVHDALDPSEAGADRGPALDAQGRVRCEHPVDP